MVMVWEKAVNKTSQVATLWVISGVLWLGSLAALVYFAMPVLELPVLAVPVGLLLAAAGVSLLALNRSQRHADDAFREVSRVKRTLQESHLRIDRDAAFGDACFCLIERGLHEFVHVGLL